MHPGFRAAFGLKPTAATADRSYERLLHHCHSRSVLCVYGSVAQTGLLRAEVLVKPTLAVSSDPSSNSNDTGSRDGMSPLPIIGGAVGVVVLIGMAAAWRRCWRRKHKSQESRRDVEVRNETHTVNLQ